MKLKKLLKCFLALTILTSIASAEVPKPKIAVLANSANRHADEFDVPFKKLGWSWDLYRANTNEMDSFFAKIDNYDFVISAPLFNWKHGGGITLPKGSMNKKAMMDYLNKGGVLIMTDVNYPETLAWVAELGPDFSDIKTGGCNSSPWQVLGSTYDTDPPHPLRFFPNKITQGNSWPHFLKPAANSKWKIATYCSEGFPVTLVQDVGKGFVALFELRQGREDQMENLFANILLRRSGINLKSFEMSPTKLGKGSVKIELTSPIKDKTTLVYELTDSNGKSQRFESEITNTVCTVDYDINVRGPITVSLLVIKEKEETTLLSRSAVMPALVELHENAYRGVLSTKRRLPDVKFQVDINPINEDLTNAKLVISIFDQCGNIVANPAYEHDFSTNAISNTLLLSVPVSKTLTAGEYTVCAEIVKKRAKFDGAKSEVKMTLLAPRAAQTIIDEDKTFLINGSPFFPVGIYHVQATHENYTKMKDIGFNSLQFWYWDDWGADKYGRDASLALAHGYDIKVLYEGANLDRIKKHRDHPAILMWYTFDEFAEGYEAVIQRCKEFREADIQHPTFALSCRDDLFKDQVNLPDVFATNVGNSKNFKDLRTFSDDRKAIIAVPGAWGFKGQLGKNEMTEEEKVMLLKNYRSFAFMAIANDVRGIIWYVWKQVGGGPIGVGLNTNERQQEVTKQICSEINIVMPGLLSTQRRSFMMSDTVDAMVCGDQNGKRFLIMANHSTEESKVEYTVDELVKVKKVRDAFGEEKTATIELNGGVISKTFAPYEVMVYNW